MNADWKGFDFRAFFQGVMKRDYWQGSSYFWGIGNSGIWHSTGFVEHADYFRAEASNDLSANLNAYIRLKNVQLGYTLPSTLTNRFYVNKLRVFVSGENLWTGTSLANMFDPETVSGGNDHNGNAYPLSKTISFGISVTL